MLWLRAAMGNYRPDEIAMPYHWRYVWSVHSDVAYGDSTCSHWPVSPSLSLHCSYTLHSHAPAHPRTSPPFVSCEQLTYEEYRSPHHQSILIMLASFVYLFARWCPPPPARFSRGLSLFHLRLTPARCSVTAGCVQRALLGHPGGWRRLWWSCLLGPLHSEGIRSSDLGRYGAWSCSNVELDADGVEHTAGS
jgi:hypothetical protein